MPQLIRSIFISPHPDDAVLSCGGTIYQLARNDQRPIVITIFGGDQAADVPLSDFARSLHDRWQLNDDAPAARRAEDRAGLERLKAYLIHLPFADAVYRVEPETRRHLYASEEAIFGSIRDGEIVDQVTAALQARIAAAMTSGLAFRVVAPLAAGRHVDHQIVREAAERLETTLLYYEDFPYAEDEARLQAAFGQDEWQSESIELSSEALHAKIEAFTQYRSQISTFFKSDEEIEQRIRAYAQKVGDGQPAERYWHKR
jgi:LmbE family N-acetylglucosaminyl deacetylase